MNGSDDPLKESSTLGIPSGPLVIRVPDLPAFDTSKYGYFGIDVGGTLCKICFYEPKEDGRIRGLLDFVGKSTTYGIPHFACRARIPRGAHEILGTTGQRDVELCVQGPHGRFHFILFETRRMENAVELVRAQNLGLAGLQASLPLTGGGAYKFASFFTSSAQTPPASSPITTTATLHLNHNDTIGSHQHIPTNHHSQDGEKVDQNGRRSLGLKSIRKLDEMRCLVDGLNFLLRSVDQECFYLKVKDRIRHPSIRTDLESIERIWYKREESVMFPYMLVNIGTGVSILKVDADGKYERISGSGLGGGTYWGLARLLTGAKNFDDSLRLAGLGDASKVDMTVGDIYGGDLTALNLDAEMTASFFGKFVGKYSPEKPISPESSSPSPVPSFSDIRDGVSDADICNALMFMVTNNIGQIAYLLANLHKIQTIFFSGTFLRHSRSGPISLAAVALSKAISFWSQDSMKALFLRHEGYFGALGAFLSGQVPDATMDSSMDV